MIHHHHHIYSKCFFLLLSVPLLYIHRPGLYRITEHTTLHLHHRSTYRIANLMDNSMVRSPLYFCSHPHIGVKLTLTSVSMGFSELVTRSSSNLMKSEN